jgi:hypothetical protein
LLLQASADERDYENTPVLSSEGYTVLVGALIQGDLMRGEIAAGAFEREYDVPGASHDGLAVSGLLEWFVTPLTTVTFDARRDADDQVSATAGLPYVTTEFGARIDHELLRPVIVTAAARVGEREYDPFDRNDEYRRVQLGAEYVLNRRAAVEVLYQYDESESSGLFATRDFEVNTLSVGLRLRL